MNGVQVGGSQLFEMSGCWYFFLCSFWTRVLLELVVRESYMIYVILEILFASCSSRWIADRICMYLKWKWYVEKFETSPSMREQNHQQWVVGRWCQDWSGMGNKFGGEWSYTIFFAMNYMSRAEQAAYIIHIMINRIMLIYLGVCRVVWLSGSDMWLFISFFFPCFSWCIIMMIGQECGSVKMPDNFVLGCCYSHSFFFSSAKINIKFQVNKYRNTLSWH